MSNIIGFVLNKDDNRLIDDLKEEGITSADIIRNSLHFYHKSIFNDPTIDVKRRIKNKNFEDQNNDKYIKYLEKELKFWKNKYDTLEKKFQNFVYDTLEKLDDTFKMMIANKYELKNVKGSINDISPKERKWLSTSKKLDELFEEKLK
jgi:hypothetical protein